MRELRPGQRCEVWLASVSGERQLLYSGGNMLLEAPNWTVDGRALILNGAGRLWRLDLAGRSLTEIALTGAPDLNNDHVLDPDGRDIFLSCDDGQIYRAPLAGGQVTRITHDNGSAHFVHGLSPDGGRLAYVGLPAGDFTRPGRLGTISSAGGASRAVEVGEGHCDGPEYSPDGGWLYLNTESFSATSGHAQLARVRPDTWPLFGGQGTLNVNSWSPDSQHFAFVAYPLDA
ncbi:MAG: TolB family protein [Actinomycetes bacterium]